MSSHHRVVSEGARSLRGRRAAAAGTAWALVVAMAVVGAVAAWVIGRFEREHARQAHALLVLARLDGEAFRQNGTEWQAIAEGHLARGVDGELRSRRDSDLAELADLGHGVDAATLRGTWMRYDAAVAVEFRLLARRRLKAAEAVDRTRVDPAFTRLHALLRVADRRARVARHRSARRAATGGWGVAVGAVAIMLGLLGAAVRAREQSAAAAVAERELRERLAAREHDALHDPLTGLPNRAQLAQQLDGALAAAHEAGGTVALLSIDLDDFKGVNDSLGHGAGDELLRHVAARLDGERRNGDLLVRQGGDEFLMLLELAPGVDSAQAAAALGARIAQALKRPFVVDDAEFRIGASVGAAIYPSDAGDAQALHSHADAAMYAAKAEGGGFVAYRRGGDDPLAQLSLATRLRQALGDDAFVLHYQPSYRLPERELVGLEALVRWHDGDRGLIAPGDFIPAAEKTGVIDALGLWVLKELCGQAARWDAEGQHPNFGVNVSALQMARPGFARDVLAIAQAHGIAPRRIVLELTESAWTLEADRTAREIHELRAAGFVLALDDFGAGYSSLSRLQRLAVDVVKIDRAFMTGLPHDPQAVAIIDAIYALARACDCDVVIEGAETPAHLRFLIARGSGLAQGFGLARPESAEATTARLTAELAAGRRTIDQRAPRAAATA